MPFLAYLSLGANLGDRAATLRAAVSRLSAAPGVNVLRVSRVYETDPVGPADQPRFLNLAAEVELAEGVTPRDVLHLAKAVEADLGRKVRERWGPREIDIDVLLVGEERVQEPDLEVPHPRMWERAFVLVPLAELIPDRRGPGGRTVAELAAALGPEQGVHAYLPV